MPPLLFWSFSAIMLLFGCLVVINRSPVASALSLVVSFLALAALYISLNAFFLGTIQVLVYAGAVMVLFLFIIMLLDLREEGRRRINVAAFFGGVAVFVFFVALLHNVLGHFKAAKQTFPAIAANVDDVRGVGLVLFRDYTLPFQVIGVLILVATIGVIILSKRELR